MALTFWQEPKRQIKWQIIAIYAAFLAIGFWFSHEGNHGALKAWKIALACWFVKQFVNLVGVVLSGVFPPKTSSDQNETGS